MKTLGSFELGKVHRVDALDGLKLLPDESVDVVFTNPPYSSGARQSAQMRSRKGMRRSHGPHGKWLGGDNLSAHGFAMLIRLLAVEALRAAKIGGHFFSFIDWRQWPVMAGTLESAGWSIRSCLVWDKIMFGMGNGFRQQAEFILHASKGVADNFVRHDIGTVLRHKRHREDAHPTQKPEPLIRLVLSAVPGEIVVDPFAGSGTTIVAAEQLGKQGLGFELDRSIAHSANERIEADRKGVCAAELRAGQAGLFAEETTE